MKIKLASSIVALFFGLSAPAIAQTTKTLTVENLNGDVIPAQVSAGYALNINFMDTDEVITFVALSNPALYALNSDVPLCNSGQNCQNGEAQLLYLRQLSGLKHSNLPATTNGQSYLTVKTVDRKTKDKNLYVFLLSPTKGQTQYHTLNFVSSAPVTSNPVIPQQVLPPNTLDLLAVSEGLALAQSQGKLPNNPELWTRIRSFIALVKDGKPYVVAIEEAKVSPSLIRQLEIWGRK